MPGNIPIMLVYPNCTKANFKSYKKINLTAAWKIVFSQAVPLHLLQMVGRTLPSPWQNGALPENSTVPLSKVPC